MKRLNPWLSAHLVDATCGVPGCCYGLYWGLQHIGVIYDMLQEDLR